VPIVWLPISRSCDPRGCPRGIELGGIPFDTVEEIEFVLVVRGEPSALTNCCNDEISHGAPP